MQKDARTLVKTILECLNYLHKKGVVHRDLKPENILIEPGQDYTKAKMIDFGTATPFAQDQVLSACIGTPYYMAPELLEKNYTEKCDIWSVGVICYMLLYG